MARRRRRKHKPADEQAGSGRLWNRRTLAAARPLVSAWCLLLAVGAAVFGLERLKHYVYALPEYSPPVKPELEVPPEADWVDREGWRPRILSAIQLPQGQAEIGEPLLQAVADRMMRSGWVSRVNRVTQEMDGTVRIACDYRRPVAMILKDGVYIPVDKDGCRLPEVYTRVSDSGWIQIVGVGADSPTPEVGERFTDDDATAGIQLASLMFRQKFASKIGAIDVRNFGGRRDRHEGHILVWPRRGQPIVWGSAPGQEFEETIVQDKLRMLAKHFESGSPQVRIDVSVYPNAWIERTGHVVRTADGSAHRDR